MWEEGKQKAYWYMLESGADNQDLSWHRWLTPKRWVQHTTG